MTPEDDDPPTTDDFPLDAVPAVLELTVAEWIDGHVYNHNAEPLPPGTSILLSNFDPRSHASFVRDGFVRVLGGKTWHTCPGEPTAQDWAAIFTKEWPGIVWQIREG